MLPRAWWTLCLLLASRGVSAADATAMQPVQYVVFLDGRVLTGVVSRQAGGYLLERSGGRMSIPREQVRCVAPSLLEAYRLQREAMIDPTAAELIQLAEWCVAYRLYEQAGDELKRALRRDPNNETARRMLARVEDLLLAQPAPVTSASASEQPPAPAVESLGGLSRSTAAMYSTRVQPLLINSCGKANCHGTATSSAFRLVPVRFDSRNHRKASEQNLAEVLRWIDFQRPANSPLLKATEGNHAEARTPVFSGSQAAAQQRLLRDWVQAVVKERRDEEARWANLPAWRTNQARQAETASPAPTDPTPGLETLPEPLSVTEAARNVSPRDTHDAFDPEMFNRQFGSRPARFQPGGP